MTVYQSLYLVWMLRKFLESPGFQPELEFSWVRRFDNSYMSGQASKSIWQAFALTQLRATLETTLEQSLLCSNHSIDASFFLHAGTICLRSVQPPSLIRSFISKGPEIELFGQLKSHWEFIDKSKFDPLDRDEAGEGCLSTSEKIWPCYRC